MAETVPPAVVRAYANAHQVFSPRQIESAVDRLAVRLTVEFQDANPVVVSLLPQATVLTGMLLRRLVFPLQCVQVFDDGGHFQYVGASAQATVQGRRAILLVSAVSADQLRLLQLWLASEGAVNVTCAGMFKGLRADSKLDEAALDCLAEGHIGSGQAFMGYGANLPGVYNLQQ
jgi:hypoxanthine-guanine phosphoribosyltransferase